MVIQIESETISQTSPIQLNFHVVATLDVTGEQARQYVNRSIIPELGTGLIAQAPELRITDDHILWRVPIGLSLPEIGDLGIVGYIDIDARSQTVLNNVDNHTQIIQHARRLYNGATLPTN